jgi:hypothetical protein
MIPNSLNAQARIGGDEKSIPQMNPKVAHVVEHRNTVVVLSRDGPRKLAPS